MAGQSLQDQLLKSGLVTSAQVKTVKTDKHKQAQQQRKNKIAAQDEAKQLAQQAKAEQAEKDRLLNQQRHQEEQQKQLVVQIKQLVEANRLAQATDGEAYHFADRGKIKTVYVSSNVRAQLVAGQVNVVRVGQSYELVPAQVAEKIRQKDPVWVIDNPASSAGEEGSEYAGYQVPDDLIW